MKYNCGCWITSHSLWPEGACLIAENCQIPCYSRPVGPCRCQICSLHTSSISSTSSRRHQANFLHPPPTVQYSNMSSPPVICCCVKDERPKIAPYRRQNSLISCQSAHNPSISLRSRSRSRSARDRMSDSSNNVTRTWSSLWQGARMPNTVSMLSWASTS